MHGNWESETGHHSLAYKISKDDREEGTTNLEWILDNWISLGADPTKLNIGLAAFGRSFALVNPNDHGYLAPATFTTSGTIPVLLQPQAGNFTGEPGFLSYYEVCQNLWTKSGWREVWLDEGKVPYAYGDEDWIGYNNVDSIIYKANMARSYGVGGLMWWTFDLDDFKGEFCRDGYFPLLTAAKENWNDRLVCYFTNWSQYRQDKGHFEPEDMDPSLCTHIIYAYAKIVEDGGNWGIGPTEWNDLDMEWSAGMYTRFHNVTDAHPGLKTLLSVGGRNHGSTEWTRMVSTNSSIDSFVNNRMGYIRKHKFDGIDIDWEFPAFCENRENCSPASDAARFKVLLEKFRAAVESENVSPANKMLISSSAGHKKNQIYGTNTGPSTTTSTTTSTDLRAEIWAPILAVILLIVIILTVWRIKRMRANIAVNRLRSDRKAQNPDDTFYERYGSSDDCKNTAKRGESYYKEFYSSVYGNKGNQYTESPI